jgi:hypothetical protein
MARLCSVYLQRSVITVTLNLLREISTEGVSSPV